jgi:hypothetical protein
MALAREALALHAAAAADPQAPLTRPSAPVLFFGDLAAYLSSPLRIITVGVNPSGEEFPADTPWSRFPGANVEPAAAQSEVERYLRALSNYFSHDPYKRWFDRSYEQVLRGLDASYYPGHASVALHTDVCTPLPTSPTWKPLPREQKRRLLTDGVPLWHRLAAELAPHVILASLSAEHFARIDLPAVSEPVVLYSLEQKLRPYEVIARRVYLGDTEPLLVWAPASTTPFQPINHGHKRRAGEAILAYLHA